MNIRNEVEKIKNAKKKFFGKKNETLKKNDENFFEKGDEAIFEKNDETIFWKDDESDTNDDK